MAAVTISVLSPSGKAPVTVRSTSARRFHVVKIVKALPDMEPVHVEVESRSDDKAKALKAAERSFRSPSQVVVRRVFDSVARSFV